MEILSPHTEDGERLTSPVVEIPTALGKIALHWLNCRIRTFQGNEQFNHIEYVDEDDQLVGFVDQEVMDILHEHNFPTLDMPYVDKGTFNWLFNGLSKSLDQELQEFEP